MNIRMRFFIFLWPAVLLSCGSTTSSTELASARLMGISLDDTVDSCIAILGEPAEQAGGGDNPFFTYLYPDRGMVVTFERRASTIKAIALIAAHDERIPGSDKMRPSPAPVTIDNVQSYPVQTVDSVRRYKFSKWHVDVILSPDERNIVFLGIATDDMRNIPPLRLHAPEPAANRNTPQEPQLDLLSISIDPMPFHDRFDRGNGTVGNGWHTWSGSMPDQPAICIADGKLLTIGGGGAFRRLSLTLPVKFSFDFQTSLLREGQDKFNRGGWFIALNAAPSALPFLAGGPGKLPSQIYIFHDGGQRNMYRGYWNNAGERVFDSIPNVAEPIRGQRDYGMSSAATISGAIQSDLSAEIVVTYNDGKLPESVSFKFPPAVNPATAAPGDFMYLSNVSLSGMHYFDNLTIEQ